MNQTPEIPDAEAALKAITAESYAERAKAVHSNGTRTESFDNAAEQYDRNPEALHGDKVPNVVIGHEKPHHVLMCYMLAGGKTIQEIAKVTGFSEVGVRQITRQPWFRKRFLRITAEAGKNQIESFLAVETLNSLETLVQIRDKEEEKGSTRVAAANSILDRALGKPITKIESDTTLNINKATDKGEDIDRQIAAVEAELKANGIRDAGTGSN
jgi:hypothetical protein